MARGRTCNQCGYHMYAQSEKHEPKGTWVWYVCRSSKCGWTVKEFEPA